MGERHLRPGESPAALLYLPVVGVWRLVEVVLRLQEFTEILVESLFLAGRSQGVRHFLPFYALEQHHFFDGHLQQADQGRVRQRQLAGVDRGGHAAHGGAQLAPVFELDVRWRCHNVLVLDSGLCPLVRGVQEVNDLLPLGSEVLRRRVRGLSVLVLSDQRPLGLLVLRRSLFKLLLDALPGAPLNSSVHFAALADQSGHGAGARVLDARGGLFEVLRLLSLLLELKGELSSLLDSLGFRLDRARR